MNGQHPAKKEAENSTRLVDWAKVTTNAVSALIATTFVGAGVVVWQAAIQQPEAIRTKVEAAKNELQATQKSRELYSKQTHGLTAAESANRDDIYRDFFFVGRLAGFACRSLSTASSKLIG